MNLDFLKPKAPPLIGVDISTSAVKMVELSETGKHLAVERYVIEPLPKDAIADGNIANLEVVGEAVKRAWRMLGSRVRNVALALPTAAVITKKITVPAGQTEAELEMQVETEANQYIPFALDEVNLDFQVLGPSPATPDEVEVLIAASRKEKVEDRVAVVEAAGLKALVVDVESFATQAAYELIEHQLPQSGKDQTIAIVDIGAAMMHINIVRDGVQVYAREQAFGGNQLTQDIQRKFSLSAEEAEAAKRNGGLPDNYEPEVLQPFMDSLAMEISRALQFFFTSTQYNSVDHILLAGGCSVIAGLDEVVASRTQVSTMIANPFLNMTQSSRIKTRQLLLDAPSLLIACGLALRRFDQ
ncbi:pilus assembly protein PilM [Chitinimonas viridis]|uniref:Pilus assembly protein PilM n=2 Tax=Chitinimonas TaxID=240411 RepID=A0ABT8B0H3_9NEIS|nr:MULTISPECIES: pilus assembly protein PilM [Chitinimonas]MDN3575738.1 pilus assembly protein PilM [Chitinimonas viridis]GLR13852.1 fimbrial assembly protein [Chitinimonas prasina]